MKRVVLIKYGELTTKKGNRNFFVKTLAHNIEEKLAEEHCTIVKDFSRMCISFEEEELPNILKKLNMIFGIHAYHVAYQIPSDWEEIQRVTLEIMKQEQFRTFKVETSRSDKNFPLASMEISKKLGAVILKNIPNIQVDVHHPDVLCQVEVHTNETYIYTNAYQGLGGYPVGTQPKALLMLSGGIDSPVAGYLSMKRGVKIDAVYFEAIPHTSLDAREKVITLTKKLVRYTNKINLHIIPFTELQEAIYKNCDPTYCITIMRRMMYRIMTELAKRQKALAIVNGESIGQVASQTLTSMSVINQVTTMPVIRPVSCLDKLEIIDIAKKIDTYETSILPFEDCCTVFVPKHPVIHPSLEMAQKMEETFDYQSMIEKTLKNVKTIVIRDEEDHTYDDLL